MLNINKNSFRLLLLIAVGYSSHAAAGQVGALTQFQSGTTAVAAEVNGNFAAVATAVDDNNARLSVVEDAVSLNTYNVDFVNDKVVTNATNIATNTANISTNTTDIALIADSVSNLTASVTTMQNGLVAVGPMSMNPSLGSGCILDYSLVDGFVAYNSSTALSICSMVSNVYLPQGMTPGGLTCRIVDNDGTAKSPLVKLYRANLDGTAPELMYQTNAVTDAASIQLVTDYTNATTGTIDNNTYSYYLTFESGGVDTAAATNASLRFYNCQVSYGNLF